MLTSPGFFFKEANLLFLSWSPDKIPFCVTGPNVQRLNTFIDIVKTLSGYKKKQISLWLQEINPVVWSII